MCRACSSFKSVGALECTGLSLRVASLVSAEVSSVDCVLLSGGIDTTFVASCHPARGRVTAITVSLGGPDHYYAVLAASMLGVGDHVVVRPGVSEFLEAVDWVLGRLGTIDPVEVAADAVHYLAAREALRLGCRRLASGDGGDELFLGYDFLLRMPDWALIEWLERVSREAWLPTVWVSSMLGVGVVAPLYSGELRRLAPRIPLDCLIDRASRIGKLPLRRYLDMRGLRVIAWRPKEPVTTGSGSMGLLERLASSWSPPGNLEEVLGFRPPTRLHSYLAWRLLEKAPHRVPPPCKDAAKACPVCDRCVDERGFCRFCGSYQGTLHY